MTISRVKSPDWGIGEVLTSTQMNAVDTNVTNALDKRAAQTDTLASEVTCSGAGRIRGTYAVGADADTTYLVSGQNATIYTPTLTANRIYTLSNTNGATNDRLLIVNGSTSAFTITVKNAAATTIATLNNKLVVTSGASSWGEFLFDGAAWVALRGGSTLEGISQHQATLAASVVIPSTGTYTDALTLSITSCLVGDLLVIDAFAPITTVAGANGLDVRLVVDDGGNTGTGQWMRFVNPLAFDHASFSMTHTVVNAGTIVVRIQGATVTAGHSILGSAVPLTEPISRIRTLRYRG